MILFKKSKKKKCNCGCNKCGGSPDSKKSFWGSGVTLGGETGNRLDFGVTELEGAKQPRSKSYMDSRNLDNTFLL